MSRLRNRMVKAEFWTDPDLLRWPLGKRVFYQGLWALAEDSGCLEDDPFGWKLQLFPSPCDSDITMETLAQWRDELVEARKLIPYKGEGKPHLYIRTFHQHEHPRNPQRPMLPMPKWLVCESVNGTGKDGRGWVRTTYKDTRHSVPDVNETCTRPLQDAPPRPAPSRVPKGTKGKGQRQRPVDNSTGPGAVAGNGNGSVTCCVCGLEIAEPAVEVRGVGLRHETCKTTRQTTHQKPTPEGSTP